MSYIIALFSNMHILSRFLPSSDVRHDTYWHQAHSFRAFRAYLQG